MKQIKLLLAMLITLLTIYSCELPDSTNNVEPDVNGENPVVEEPAVVETTVTFISDYIGDFSFWAENIDSDGSTISLTINGDVLDVEYDTTTSSTLYPYAQAQVVPVDAVDVKVPFTDVKSITVEYKSDSVLKMALNDEGNDGKDYAHLFAVSDVYVEVTVNLNDTDFAQPDWATGSRDLVLSNVVGLVFSGQNTSGGYSIKSISVQ